MVCKLLSRKPDKKEEPTKEEPVLKEETKD